MDLMTQEEFLAFQELVKDDLKFDSVDLLIEFSNHLGKHHHYLSIYTREKDKLDQLELLLKKTRSNVYFQYRFDRKSVEEGFALNQKQDYDMAIDKDTDYIKVKRTVERQKLVVDYLNYVLKLFENRKWILEDSMKMIQMDRSAI